MNAMWPVSGCWKAEWLVLTNKAGGGQMCWSTGKVSKVAGKFGGILHGVQSASYKVRSAASNF